MVDLNKEREAFDEEFKGVGREYSTSKNSVGFSGTLSANELGWLACAESKQSEIDSLKAENERLKEKLAKVESGEFVLVPKNELIGIAHSIRHCNSGEIYDTDIEASVCEIEAMIEAAQEGIK